MAQVKSHFLVVSLRVFSRSWLAVLIFSISVLIFGFIREQKQALNRWFNLPRIRIVIALFLLIGLSFPLVYADRGMIPVYPGISVYEPGQKAILAWNGYEEIMILSTDVTSSEETIVLEIMPVPSEPNVEAASFQAFEQIQSLIWEEGMNQLIYSTKSEARSEGVEVVFHEQIGAHNITVVKASDTSELVNWMEDFLTENGLNEKISLQDFETVIKDYMSRGFRYYVLDLITVSQEERSVNPILYRFNSSFLYYPLVISSPINGDTEITLFLLTEGKVEKDYAPMQKTRYRTFWQLYPTIEFMLSRGDLSKIDLRIGEMFQDGAWLTVLTYDGKLELLTRDLMIAGENVNPDATINVEVTIPPTLIAMCILLGTASTLAGVISILLITHPKKNQRKRELTQ